MKKFLIVAATVLLFAMVAPFTAAAATNSEVIAILAKGLEAIQMMVRDAYCAAGVTAFCP